MHTIKSADGFREYMAQGIARIEAGLLETDTPAPREHRPVGALVHTG